MKTKESCVVEVVAKHDLGGQRFRLELKASPIHLSCQPGQFFNLAFVDQSPYLPRPFSVYNIYRETSTIDLLIADVGEGTHKLDSCQPGDKLLLVGPLGNGFSIKSAPHHVFVAGSIGLAPFIELHRELKKQEPQTQHTLIYGARNKEQLVDTDFLKTLDWEIKECTDDGSQGTNGTVVDVLKAGSYPKGTSYYTCGPNGMMRAVSELIATWNEKLWVSMEEHMACGIGICKGCVVYDPQKPPPLLTICRNGPIFESQVIFYPERATRVEGLPQQKP